VGDEGMREQEKLGNRRRMWRARKRLMEKEVEMRNVKEVMKEENVMVENE
jgi:hypothetical protein